MNASVYLLLATADLGRNFPSHFILLYKFDVTIKVYFKNPAHIFT